LLLRHFDGSVMLHIREMRRYSELSHIIHLESPDLDFRRKTEHSKYGSVNALIAVEFRNRDIILDFFDERRVIFMDDSQHHITIAYRLGDDSVGKQIHHGTDFRGLVSFLEFLEHSIRTFDPSLDFEILDSFFVQHVRQCLDSSLRIFFSFAEIFFQVSENIIE